MGASAEWKDRYFTKTCDRCGERNHIVVTYDGAKNTTLEVGRCFNCNAPVHEETCFMIWVAPSRQEVERRVSRAAGLARLL
jgi:hypothetical protein